MSALSVGGVAMGTMALIVVLSVFNGFDNLVRSLFGSFDPDIKVTVKEGKTFIPDKKALEELKKTPGVADFAEVLEDKALLRYDDKQTIAVVKGVTDNFSTVTGIDSMIRQGKFALSNGKEFLTVVGQGIAYFLNINLNVNINYRPPISIYVPRRMKSIPVNPERAINRRYITPGGIFSIEQDFDARYIIVPIEFARDLFGYSKDVTGIEIKLGRNVNTEKVQEKIGPGFDVKTRFQQNELFYKTMKAEKWAIFLILIFILAIASFNVIGSLTMLILEKKKDIAILRSMGADMSLIKKIFQAEGWLISILGALIGLIFGLIICWLQIKYKLVKLQGSGSFVVDAYPVNIQLTDVLIIIIAVLIVGYFAAWYPIRYVTRRFVKSGDAAIY